MASVRTLVTIKRAGKYLPPNTVLHGLSRDEVEGLLPHVERLPGDEEEPEAAFLTVVEAVELSPPTEVGEAAREPPEAVSEAVGDETEEETRVEQVSTAIDLLDATDFTKDGKPKAVALTGVLGWRPTADEIKLAVALRDEMGL